MIKNPSQLLQENAKHLSLHPRMTMEDNKTAKDYFKY